jgi:hypothetical protein
MMSSQLAALATQSRKALALFDEDELDALNEEPIGPHRFISASLQLWLSLELVAGASVPGRHVPHLAMMLSIAFSHRWLGVQPARHRNENANPRNARFMTVSTQIG